MLLTASTDSSRMLRGKINIDTLFTARDFEQQANNALPMGPRKFYLDSQPTTRSNKEANRDLSSWEMLFNRYYFVPRILVDPAGINLTTEMLSTTYQLPIGISPTAMHRLAHSDGEIATAVRFH